MKGYVFDESNLSSLSSLFLYSFFLNLILCYISSFSKPETYQNHNKPYTNTNSNEPILQTNNKDKIEVHQT